MRRYAIDFSFLNLYAKLTDKVRRASCLVMWSVRTVQHLMWPIRMINIQTSARSAQRVIYVRPRRFSVYLVLFGVVPLHLARIDVPCRESFFVPWLVDLKLWNTAKRPRLRMNCISVQARPRGALKKNVIIIFAIFLQQRLNNIVHSRLYYYTICMIACVYQRCRGSLSVRKV